jgi:hypothetical protein
MHRNSQFVHDGAGRWMIALPQCTEVTKKRQVAEYDAFFRTSLVRIRLVAKHACIDIWDWARHFALDRMAHAMRSAWLLRARGNKYF